MIEKPTEQQLITNSHHPMPCITHIAVHTRKLMELYT